VRDALGRPQSVAVFGATSEIGRAIIDALVARGASRLVLAGRDEEALNRLASHLRTGSVHQVEVSAFDAADPASHPQVVENVFAGGDIDVVLLAFGVLGSQEADEDDPAAAAGVVQTNFTGAVSLGVALAARLRRQGHGAIVVLSSVAGERARRSNFIYGSSKAGLDAFYQGLAAALDADGIHVMVVRPGFVKTRMTQGLPPAPLATTPEAVAEVVVRGLDRGARVVWAPPTLRWVMTVLRHLPTPIFRRLPL